MKILYAIQGTGNGHLSRARDIVPILQNKGKLDILVSGTQADVQLPYPIRYKLDGLSFVFGKKGGIDMLETYRKSNIKKLFREIGTIPIKDYDIVINDFEPVTAWACKLANKPCIGLSHQAAVTHLKAPRPSKSDLIGLAVLKNYAPVSAAYGFHFEQYGQDIFTPVIRSEIRKATPLKQRHYTVYLPAYDNERIINVLSEIPEIDWQVFSKHTQVTIERKNITVYPISNDLFVQSLINCTGVLCGAGFETPAEALFLNKKLMVIPMKRQYEQQCNAAALANMGVPVIKSLKMKHLDTIEDWVYSKHTVQVEYPDTTEQIIDTLLANHLHDTLPETLSFAESVNSVKQLKELILANILKKATSVKY